MKVITKRDCAKCEKLKEKIGNRYRVDYIDAETTRGMALYHYYRDMDGELPILIDGETGITGIINIMRRLETVEE